MAKYKVKVIQHLLKGNQIAKSGDVVDGSKFINLQHSIEGNYVELVGKESKNKKAVDNDVDPEAEKLKSELKTIKGFNKEALIKYATDNELTFDEAANKKTILAEVIEQVSNPKKAEKPSEEEE